MLNRNSSEKEFEDFLKNYPYLIDENLINGKVDTQISIELFNGKTGIIDILFDNIEKIVVIELKKGKIQPVDITQLTDYVNYYKSNFPEKEIQGILIGQEINQRNLNMIEQKGFSYKELFTDIPIRIKLCLNCRKIIAHKENICKWCESKIFKRI